MRVAHISDIHFTLDAPLASLWGKRMLGTANQVLRGRRHHFPPEVKDRLLEHLRATQPDVLVITGDLTAQALLAEFELARQTLEPVIRAIPTFMIPGNHDVYTQGSVRDGRFAQTFAEWMGQPDGAVRRFDHHSLTVIGLDPNRPTFLDAAGWLPQDQLDDLCRLLDSDELSERTVIVATHYPLLDRRGGTYDGWNHGLRNAERVMLAMGQCKRLPDLVIHGHQHHGYRAHRELPNGVLHTCNSGSSGYVFQPERHRAAAMNIYHTHQSPPDVERFIDDGQRFALEAGGAYATGG